MGECVTKVRFLDYILKASCSSDRFGQKVYVNNDYSERKDRWKKTDA